MFTWRCSDFPRKSNFGFFRHRLDDGTYWYGFQIGGRGDLAYGATGKLHEVITKAFLLFTGINNRIPVVLFDGTLNRWWAWNNKKMPIMDFVMRSLIYFFMPTRKFVFWLKQKQKGGI